MNTNPTIRPEQPGDYGAIDEVNRLAFGDEGEVKLVRAIRAGEGFDPALSLVAEVEAGDKRRDEQRIVGHILFSPIRIEDGKTNHPALALAPMAVRPDHQRSGVGSALVRQGLDACRDRLDDAIIVTLGHAAYYPRFGFTPARTLGIEPPFPAPDEAWMVQGLTPGALEGVRGTVRYPACFDQV